MLPSDPGVTGEASIPLHPTKVCTGVVGPLAMYVDSPSGVLIKWEGKRFGVGKEVECLFDTGDVTINNPKAKLKNFVLPLLPSVVFD